jgi:hypothetical protein
MNEQLHVPTDRQRAYLRYLLSQAHAAGVPYLPIDDLHRDAVTAWIEYLDLLVQAHWNIQRDLAKLREAKTAQAYLVTPPRDQLPSSYHPPCSQRLKPGEELPRNCKLVTVEG